MAKFSERRRYVLRVIQPSTGSTLSEYDSRPQLARYVWYVTWYLRSSCCSETHYATSKLPVFLPLSTLDVTHVRKCTRPSPLYRTASDGKLGMGLGTRPQMQSESVEGESKIWGCRVHWNTNWNELLWTSLTAANYCSDLVTMATTTFPSCKHVYQYITINIGNLALFMKVPYLC